MLSMTECDKRGSDAALCSKLLRRSRKNQKRLTARSFSDIDVAPTHRFADASAKRFRNSFLCRETHSQMSRWKFHRHRILNFTVGKNTMEKSIAEPIDGTLNASAFHKIDTDTNDAHESNEVFNLELTSRSDDGLNRDARIVWSARTCPRFEKRRHVAALLKSLDYFSRSSGIIRHRSEHFLHGVIEAHRDRTRDNRVANIQLGEPRDLMNQRNIFVIDAVTRVDLQV